MKLLEELLKVQSPSGEEIHMTNYIISYVEQNKANWKVQPQIIHNSETQDCILLVFGKKPRVSIYAHMDTTGFTVRYNKGLVRIGGADGAPNDNLIATDSEGSIACNLCIDPEKPRTGLTHNYNREIDRGTSLTYKPEFTLKNEYITSPYLDNRVGLWNVLKVAETLESGIISFTCGEETDGGSVANLARIQYRDYGIQKALISDITWVTDGVFHGEGVAISLRDGSVPRKYFVQQVINVASRENIHFQLEVEDAGGSDGSVLQVTDLPIDWCFIGAPIDKCHTSKEKIHTSDMESMKDLYSILMKEL
ncbi:MAG: aminopeptidase [Flavobacteriales bacterium]|nr:aminopeptidase [Flavobacteriales bacterium]